MAELQYELNTTWLRKHSRYRTAIHEAGHAVLALHLCIPFADVTVLKDDDYNGRISYLEFRTGEEECVRVLLAGIMAMRLTRQRWNQLLFQVTHNDLRDIANYLNDNAYSMMVSNGVYNLQQTVLIIIG